MSSCSIDVYHGCFLNAFEVMGVKDVTGSLSVTTFVKMVVAGCNSAESVFHFHLTIEGSGHVAIGAKVAIG